MVLLVQRELGLAVERESSVGVFCLTDFENPRHPNSLSAFVAVERGPILRECKNSQVISISLRFAAMLEAKPGVAGYLEQATNETRDGVFAWCLVAEGRE